MGKDDQLFQVTVKLEIYQPSGNGIFSTYNTVHVKIKDLEDVGRLITSFAEWGRQYFATVKTEV